MYKLPEKFEQLVRHEIENDVLPNLETMVLDHFPNLNATYKPEDSNSFLFAYTIGSLEDAYHKVYISQGFGEYSDEEYFGIHRLISEYRDPLKTKIKKYLQRNE